MKSFDQYLAIVNEAINNIKDRYPKQPTDLYAPIFYTMSLGGKRLRPVLMLMACEAVGGKAGEALMPAVGLELFHNFTLLHDDLMDRADVRRGKPTVYRKWNDNVAILSGDAMLTMATQHIARARGEVLPQVMELFNKTAMEIYEGQQWDMDFESRNDVKVDEYLEMIRLKTSVLLGCACKMGALLGGANAAVANDFYNLGVNIGLAFQLQDDVLDVWGDPATFGKATGGDIMNNKKTFLLINAMNMATGDDAKELNHWLEAADAKPEEKIPAVTAIYEKLGLRELSDTFINMYSNHALETLNAMRIDKDAAQAFADLTAKLIKRDR
ncbi:MAG: polyprenyl synthetase family protein [Bacteroidales bacterium]|nr:polyprenyl synthetase family protein [Candidatus Sodaliphilus fimicaballi]